MQLLLTNDDGIDAPGLAALAASLSHLGQIAIVAPDTHLSGCSHQVSVDRPLQATKVGDNRFAVDGTPADCTRLGLSHLVPDVDWVLAGINDGGNLGVDVFMSGTVAAVREAALMGKSAIAFSQFRRNRRQFDWPRASAMVELVIGQLLELSLEPGGFWNVNFPDLDGDAGEPDVVFCPRDSNPLPIHYEIRDDGFHYRGDYQERERHPGTDVDVCFNGNIAVTQLRIDG